jgi:proteasome lid subunit RPN8/RPN11
VQGAGLPVPAAGLPSRGVDSRTMILTPEEYARIQAQAIAEYPSECCGVVMERPGAQSERLLLTCRNIQNELHAKDPKRHPRDARTAYYIDPRDLIAMGRQEAQGFRVLTIYHSHIDAGAYFSPTDRHNALINGEPAYPDATYVVLSVVDRRVAETGVFRWDPALRDFATIDWRKPDG